METDLPQIDQNGVIHVPNEEYFRNLPCDERTSEILLPNEAVMHLPGTSGDRRPVQCTRDCTSWLRHYKVHTATPLTDDIRCCAEGCTRNATIGAHVFLTAGSVTARKVPYIVPTCHGHNTATCVRRAGAEMPTRQEFVATGNRTCDGMRMNRMIRAVPATHISAAVNENQVPQRGRIN